MSKHIPGPGFIPPAEHSLAEERRSFALAQLLATVGLALCTVIAATVVSVGIARANAASAIIDNESGLFALALVLGLAFIGAGSLTLLSLPPRRKSGAERHGH